MEQFDKLKESLADRIHDAKSIPRRIAAFGIGAGELVGQVLAGIVGAGLGVFAGIGWAFLGGLLKRLPKRSKFGLGLAKAGYNVLLGTNADAILNVIYGDGVVKPRPAQYNADEKAFKTANGDTYSVGGIGFDPKRFDGAVPIAWALRASNEITEPFEAVVANARELGEYKKRTDQEPKDMHVQVDPNRQTGATGNGHGAARADGGAVDELDGQVVSFRKGYELFGSKVTQEQMEEQEKRGKLAVLDMANRSQLKWGFLLLIAFGLGLFGPGLASQVAGGAAEAASDGMGFGLGGVLLPVI